MNSVSLYSVKAINKLILLSHTKTAFIVLLAVCIGTLIYEVKELRDNLNKVELMKQSAEAELQKHERKVNAVAEYIRSVNNRVSLKDAREKAELEIVSSKGSGVHLALGLAITMQESRFDCEAISPTMPVGCKQIAASHWSKELGYTRQQLMNKEVNIKSGYYIVTKLKRIYGSDYLALQRYYGGDDATNKRYAERVLKEMRKVEKLLQNT